MRVDRISYQKIFPTGMAYLNHKIGVEMQVDEGDDWQEAFEMAKRMVDKWNLESNPSYATAMEYMKTEIPETNVAKEKLAIAIENSQSIQELKQYESDSMKYDLVQQYIDKRKTLQS